MEIKRYAWNEVHEDFNDGTYWYRYENIKKLEEDIRNLCIDALITDGGHHKQWYIERILEKLGYNLAELKRKGEIMGYYYEDGIAP